MSEEIEVLMKSDIVDIAKSDYKIKQLVRKYLQFYLKPTSLQDNLYLQASG